MSQQSTAPLTILRHPMQRMLQAALHKHPNRCQGAFGGPSARVIAQAATDDDPEIESILEHAHPESMGLFYSEPNGHTPDLAQVRHVAISLQMGQPPYLILLALDTEGRMEAHAYHLAGDKLIPLELVLAEDHALNDIQSNG